MGKIVANYSRRSRVLHEVVLHYLAWKNKKLLPRMTFQCNLS
jgi:hypothetical protein